MKINKLNFSFNELFSRHKMPCKTSSVQTQNTSRQNGIFVKTIKTDAAQQATINQALVELSGAVFDKNDSRYMKNLGINLPFSSGLEAVNYLKNQNAKIMYAEFSDKKVHACLDTTGKTPSILINADYKNLTEFDDILAISEAIAHETGHMKDNDILNSISEEIDCLALNVLVHRSHRKKYPKSLHDKSLPLYSEGVNLYSKLFFDSDPKKTALKQRIGDKYGYLEISSPNHPESKLSTEIKAISENKSKYGLNTNRRG